MDDEKSILKAIKRELVEAEFDVMTANSARKALDILTEDTIDIVVSDIKMPEISGIDFLKTVKEKYPHIHRVILSGYVEEEGVFIAIQQGIATTYFVKPWKAEVLRDKLEHILKMKELFKNRKLVNTLNSIRRIPVLPRVYSDLLKAIGEKKSNKEIADIISKDISVSTKILQIVNSAYYGIKRQITSIERGILFLGINNIKDMVLTLTLISELEWSKFQKQILEEIIFKSSLINNIFNILYKKRFNQIVKEEFSSIGITHNIGKIILLQYFPESYKNILDYYQAHPIKDFYSCELEVNPDNSPHTQIGGYLLNLWNLHSINVEAALFHHEPEKSSESTREIIRIFNLAIQLVEVVEVGESVDLRPYVNQNFSKDVIKEIIIQIREKKRKK